MDQKYNEIIHKLDNIKEKNPNLHKLWHSILNIKYNSLLKTIKECEVMLGKNDSITNDNLEMFISFLLSNR